MKKLIASFTGLLTAFTALQAAGAAVSGITDFAFDAAPQAVTRKMYNWEITLSAADSKKGKYEIVQVNHYLSADGKTPDTTNVLIDSAMVSSSPSAIVHFAVAAGDKQPKQNMGAPGQIGEPIVYLGLGTTKVSSDWITLPGTQIDRAAPSGKGTELVDGALTMIEFDVTDKDGQKVQSKVMLRREPAPK